MSDINTSIVGINGDGLMDIVKKENNTTMHVWYNKYNKSTGTINFDYATITMPDNRRLNLLYDWDGDGIADRIKIAQVSSTQKDLSVYLGQRSLTTVSYPSTLNITITNYGSFSDSTSSRDGIIKMPLDMDGNGETDKLTLSGSNISANFQKNGVYSADTPFNNFGTGYLRNFTMSSTTQKDTIVDLMDINGDGLPDRVLKAGAGQPLQIIYNMMAADGACPDRLKSVVVLMEG